MDAYEFRHELVAGDWSGTVKWKLSACISVTVENDAHVYLNKKIQIASFVYTYVHE